MTQIGQLRERVEIQASAPTDDGAGGRVDHWSTAHSCRARIEPLAGGERLQGDQIVASQGYRVTLRRPPSLTVTPRHRLLWHAAGGDKTLAIVGIANPDERGRFLAILADDQGLI